jgi:hypothetical protein
VKETIMRPRFYWTVSAALALWGCVGEITGDDDAEPPPPPVCEATRTYVGFGGTGLEANRVALAAGSDRLRLKPFAALSAEYARVLGLASVDTSAYAATFGRPPPRWYIEPAASANTLYGAFALAYSACSAHTATGTQYEAAPAAESANLNCRELARRAWNRRATDAEVAACATFAITQTDPADAPRRRWAYSCAAVLSASGFLAY